MLRSGVNSVVFLGPEERPNEKTFLGGAGIKWCQWKAQEGVEKRLINPHRNPLEKFMERINLIAIIKKRWQKAMQEAMAAGYTTSGRDI